MKLFVAAVLLALSVVPAWADKCSRYLAEDAADDWIVQTEYGFDWHKDGDVYAYEIGRYTDEGDPRLVANIKDGLDSEMTGDDFVRYRFANINGKDALLWDGWFYYRACASTS